MSHRNARLNLRGRLLLVDRIRRQGWAVAHAAKAQGVSRQCAHRWIRRFDTEGVAGLSDRSSRPRRYPTRTPPAVELQVLQLRSEQRRGQDWIGPELGVAARTVGRILRRHRAPYLAECDPLTGQVIRASKATTTRYERDRPGQLVHMDVKKIGKIPDGGGWRAHGLADEKGPTCATFLLRAAAYFARHGITEIERLLTDNAFAYRHSRDLHLAVAQLGARQLFIKPHCPWQNGKAERYNRTLQVEWAYRRAFHTNSERTAALAPWLEYYNTQRRHTALHGLPPISRVSPTS